MTNKQPDQILAQRLLDHFTRYSRSSDRWIEISDNPLDSEIYTAEIADIVDKIFEACEEYNWEGIQNHIESKIKENVGQIDSDLNRVEAATADFFLNKALDDLYYIMTDAQKRPVTYPRKLLDFDFDPVVQENNNIDDEIRNL